MHRMLRFGLLLLIIVLGLAGRGKLGLLARICFRAWGWLALVSLVILFLIISLR